MNWLSDVGSMLMGEYTTATPAAGKDTQPNDLCEVYANGASRYAGVCVFADDYLHY